VPSNDGIGLDDGQRRSPVGPESGEDDPKGSISIRQAGPLRIPLENMELMAKREVLEGQCAMGLQGREQRSEKDGYHGDHDIMKSS
jgi:hypothetical protein